MADAISGTGIENLSIYNCLITEEGAKELLL